MCHVTKSSRQDVRTANHYQLNIRNRDNILKSTIEFQEICYFYLFIYFFCADILDLNVLHIRAINIKHDNHKA